MAELARLGKDPGATTSQLPTGSANAVFDLTAGIFDPDGPGPEPANGIVLSWTERLCGDFDQNGEVDISDLTPLGLKFGAAVNYASPDDHGGVACWPAGNPADQGTGSANWRLARIDGDENGEINLADITPIAVHWKESLQGYNVYRRLAGSAEFELLAGPEPGGCSAPRASTFAEGSNKPADNMPVRFEYIDHPAKGAYEYYVVSVQAGSYEEGPESRAASASYTDPPAADFTMDPATGDAPITIEFDGSASSDPDGSVEIYSWDFDADGTIDESSGAAVISHEFSEPGEYTVRLTVEDDMGAEGFADKELVLGGNHSPRASLNAAPTEGSIPMTVTLDASFSIDLDGSVVSYEFDPEGAGTFSAPQATPLYTYTYEVEGEYEACVRVTDNGGRTSESCAVISAGPYDPSGTWNLLYWAAGDSHSWRFKYDNINELEEIGSTDNIRILVGFDLPGADGEYLSYDQVHFIKVVPNQNPYAIDTEGDPANVSFPGAGYDSADPQHLIEFIQWAEVNFPADHTVLFIGGAGTGWRLGTHAKGGSSMPGAERTRASRATSGLLKDITDDDPLWSRPHWEVAAALQGRRFDMIWLEGDCIGQLEVIYDFRNLTDWLVATDSVDEWPSTPMDNILSDWNSAYPISPPEIAEIFIDRTIEAGVIWCAGELDYHFTRSLYDMREVDDLVASLTDLRSQVADNAAGESAAVQDAIVQSYEPIFGAGDRDLLTFLESYRATTADPEIAATLDEAIDAANAVVVYTNSCNQPETKGLQIFLPDGQWFDPFFRSEYSELPFNDTTHWLDLFAATGVPGWDGVPHEVDWVPGDKLEITWAPELKPYLDMELTDPTGKWGTPNQPGELAGVLEFSEDGWPYSDPVEWCILQEGAPAGTYRFDLDFYEYLYNHWPPAAILVTVKLYDGEGALKQDLGTASVYWMWQQTFAYLHYEP